MAFLKEAKAPEEVKMMPVGQLRKAYNELAEEYGHLTNMDYIMCYKCPPREAFKSTINFYADDRYPIGYFPVCKKCLMKMATDMDPKTRAFSDNRDKTIATLRFLDWPYIDSLYQSSLSHVTAEVGEKTKATAWQHMITILRSLPHYKGLTFEDSELPNEVIEEESSFKRTARPEIKKIFGSGFGVEDYIFLQDKYDDWRVRTQVDSISQETYIVQICFKQLEIWKAQKSGKDTTNLIKSLNDLMSAANLQPKQNVGNAATDSLTFGQLIEKWEEEKPIPKCSPEFEDVDGIGKYLRVFFAGHLSKALGLTNSYSTEYEEEMAKYTIGDNNKQDDGSDEFSDSIYTQIFGSNSIS